ncbi:MULTISPECIES: hypothetical protein [unclassified Bradyrhizobium]|uniref:hypothetical protein n=1 Tax=unclassified Bradyrhizobium TaxID=2631580 RepID=UPI002478C6C9|nr:MULTISPECIES: hypothetical protein [unclassified Bradyrhizobium]WGS17500.1 hypothetical protein MTX22_22910 [Bradyrhizobium sp. ISRA463]WGS24280.1 hypothetical protein MTX19_20580 [Bradyrhizobium sp. ISRA464]
MATASATTTAGTTALPNFMRLRIKRHRGLTKAYSTSPVFADDEAAHRRFG